MANCFLHPGREATVLVSGKDYCAQCEAGQREARANIDNGIRPKDCFVWHIGGDRWERIRGTGCAHFVAHEKNIRALGGVAHCLEGLLIRVPDLLPGKTEIREFGDVKPGDIYVTDDRRHCGIVRFNIPGPGRGKRRIMIEHASSRMKQVLTSDFTVYFRGQGSFFR
jgi:hypothetical protein